MLAYTYELSRSAIHGHLLALTRTRGVIVDKADRVQEALDAFATGAADYVILAGTRRAGCKALLTFDRRLVRERGVSAL